MTYKYRYSAFSDRAIGDVWLTGFQLLELILLSETLFSLFIPFEFIKWGYFVQGTLRLEG